MDGVQKVLSFLAANWLWFAIALYALVEYILPRTDKVKARSLLEAIANLLGAIIWRRIGVNLGTPPSLADDRKDPPDDDAPTPPGGTAAALKVVSLILLLPMLACAHGSDGVRQACANTNSVLEGSYRSFTAWYKLDQAVIRERAKTDQEGAVRMLAEHEPIARKTLTAFDIAKAAKIGYCSEGVFAAIDAGQRKDRAAIIAALLQIASDLNAKVATLGKELR